MRAWLVVALCLASPLAWAAGGSVSITVTQTTQLGFGVLQIPASSQTFSVATTGATSGTGTQIYGVTAPGVYSIKCQSGGGCASIDIDVRASALNCTGITGMGPFTINYNNEYIGAVPKTGLSNPSSGKTLTVGSTLTYTAAVGANACQPTVDIVVTGH